MKILDQLEKAIQAAEPNILGNRSAKIEIDGVSYSVSEQTASARHSAQSWGKRIYRLNGKQIAKAKLAE